MGNDKMDDPSSDEAETEERYDSRPPLGYTLFAVLIAALFGAIFLAIMNSLFG